MRYTGYMYRKVDRYEVIVVPSETTGPYMNRQTKQKVYTCVGYCKKQEDSNEELKRTIEATLPL